MSTSKFKPLLFTTTMRNPERLKTFLTILSNYDGKILNNDIIKSIAIELIKNGEYKPTRVPDVIKAKWKMETILTDEEAIKILEDNPQEHKEAGFDKGWPSRFDTWYKIAKELGFVYYEQDKEINFSTTGKMLIDFENPQNEQFVFLNSFSKYYRNNPYRRVKNNNNPLILLLKLLFKLKENPNFSDAGVSKKEIPLILCWKDDNVEELYNFIVELRKSYSYTPSDEVVLEKCYSLCDKTKRDDDSILNDYPDDFIRKIRLTGLISIRGGGRFISINEKEIKVIEYLLKNYKLENHQSEIEFYKYISNYDIQLIEHLTTFKNPIRSDNNELSKWANEFNWEFIKNELLLLANKKKTNNNLMKVIYEPLRLEFLTSLAIFKKLPNVDVKPNYVSDSEGLPVSFASGGYPDIECTENGEKALIEVTLLTGTQQHIRESFSIRRHLEDYLSKGYKSYTLFVSPKVHVDTCRYAEFVKYQNNNLEIKIQDISLFVEQLEVCGTLLKLSQATSCCE